MFIIKHKKIFIAISTLLVIASIISLFVFGLKVGIDFKGGALMEVVYENNRPTQVDIESSLAKLDLGAVLVQPTGDTGYIIKTRDITEAEHLSILSLLATGGQKIEEKSFNSVGPSVGAELTRKAIIAIVLVSLAIICFIAFAFRRVSKPVSSWRYGFIAIVTLLHDVIIPVGMFVVLSHYYGAELDTLFVVAVLTILGLSVSDTIVIFDRIRENLKNATGNVKDKFSEIVGVSVEQSFARSIATSLTVILVLLALFFFGPSTTRYFALMLTTGMFFGTYSSIFLASPLLVWVEELQNKK
ncbi:MAG: protein translocase subunit SecF [Candidatus Pacebacteria bacterium]|nr:protein translocase subunit SecF [Candidatus Paceibacterota bacterium]